MRYRALLVVLALALAGAALGQTNTPTNTPTATSTPTRTPTPAPLIGAAMNLTVPSGGTDTNVLFMTEGRVTLVTILVPATIDGTVTVQLSDTRDASATWRTLSVGGSDVSLVAGKAIILPELSAAALRIHESTTAAAARTFVVMGALR